MATAAPATELGRKRPSTTGTARAPTFSLSRSVKKALSGADAGSAIAVERRPDQDADDLEVHLVRRRGGDGGKALYAVGGGSLAVLVAFLLYMIQRDWAHVVNNIYGHSPHLFSRQNDSTGGLFESEKKRRSNPSSR